MKQRTARAACLPPPFSDRSVDLPYLAFRSGASIRPCPGGSQRQAYVYSLTKRMTRSCCVRFLVAPMPVAELRFRYVAAPASDQQRCGRFVARASLRAFVMRCCTRRQASFVICRSGGIGPRHSNTRYLILLVLQTKETADAAAALIINPGSGNARLWQYSCGCFQV
jgi:hypothetical protein